MMRSAPIQPAARVSSIVAMLVLGIVAATATAADVDEFRVKRESVFEFAEPPAVSRSGDRVTLTFAAKSFCDVTVAVEDPRGRILRHLASGVLGENAPPPFAKGPKRQTLHWDGKDDQGRYVVDNDGLTVRVSLGLKPAFEKNLFASPYRRLTTVHPPIMTATPGGVLVYEGRVMDSVRLYDHAGGYLRTVYPFPAGKLGEITDLNWHTFPQDGVRLPLKQWFRQATLLTSGSNSGVNRRGPPFGVQRFAHDGHGVDVPHHAATAMAARAGRMVLTMNRINRLTLDGSAPGGKLNGPKVTFPAVRGGRRWYGGDDVIQVPPYSAALSPDGRWLYMTGYRWVANHGTGGRRRYWLPGVTRAAVDGVEPATVFAGSMTKGDDGDDDRHLRIPTCVACDAAGRVYVADYMNDRIQVFSPQAKLLKTLRVEKPAWIALHHRTGEIYVFRWLIENWHLNRKPVDVEARVIRLGPFDDPKPRASWPLTLNEYSPTPHRGGHVTGFDYRAALDSWTDPPTIWLFPGEGRPRPWWRCAGVQLLQPAGGRLVVRRDFAALAAKAVVKTTPQRGNRQRIHLNPATGRLFVLEGSADKGNSASIAVEIDPETGRARVVELPFDAEDMAFDADGQAYLRGTAEIARFDPATWREVPWDYGGERKKVGWANTKAKGPGMRQLATALSALPIPGWRHNTQSGMAVSPRGHLVVGIRRSGIGEEEGAADVGLQSRKDPAAAKLFGEKSYEFRIYPGRSVGGLVMVFDRHGQVLYDDAVPGLAWADGFGIDNQDNLYVLAKATRRLDGEPYFNPATNTLIKITPKRAKVLSAAKKDAVPVAPKAEELPDRPADLFGGSGTRLSGSVWVQNAQWFYGGVGYNGRHGRNPDFGCDCWNSRFALDYFARSFAPEIGHCSVAVLDSNGNLILRVGRYGNADDDGVPLFYAPFVATHTDRRLFIADLGNGRIISVKLGYHATATVPLPAPSSPGR